MEKFLIRRKGTEDSQEAQNCSSAKYNKLSSNDFSNEPGSQTSGDDNSNFSEDERDAHDESHASKSTCSTNNTNSLDKTDECETSKKSDSNPIKKSHSEVVVEPMLGVSFVYIPKHSENICSKWQSS